MAKKNVKIMSDPDLYILIKKKDKSGFNYMYAQYGCILYGLALNAVTSKEYAAEIVELTFAKTWKSMDLFINQKSSMNVWMIQNLIVTIKEYLSSKDINYSFRMGTFPSFNFNVEQENSVTCKSVDVNKLSLNII